jgi:hypothetical protein
LCGDLFTQAGEGLAISTDSPMEATIVADQMFGYTCGAPQTAAVLEGLAALRPSTLALMHGPTHRGPGDVWLNELADVHRLQAASPG